MNIKNLFIVGSLVTMLAATGCSSQASMRNNPARNLTNSANRAYERNHNNAYGYGYDGYDNYGHYTADGYFINDYVNNYAGENYSGGIDNPNNYNYGRGYNNYNGINGFSYDNTGNYSVETLALAD